MTTRRAAIMVAGLVIGVACSDAGTAPKPSEKPPVLPKAVLVTLNTPNGDDGAVVVTLHGPDLSTIEPTAGYLTYSRAMGPQEMRLIVVGNLASGALVTVKLGNGHSPSEYSASVDEVATRSDAIRASTGAYTLTFSAAP